MGERKVSSAKAAVKDKTQPRCSQGQRLILQVASLSPSSSCSCPRCATPRFTARSIPAQLWHVKLFTAVQMTRTALALWFFIIYVINPSRATLSPVPCTHDPLQFSLGRSLRRHARFRAFACVVHIWQHVACRLPQLTNGCLSGENMFLRNFIRLHLVVAPSYHPS